MNEDVKELWTTALLSGKYKQGRKRLTAVKEGVTTDCCLGVLCKIAVAQGMELEIRSIDYDGDLFIDYNGEGSTLPQAVRDWAGLDQSNPVVTDAEHGRNSLAEFNDNGKTFSEIAEIIERNL